MSKINQTIDSPVGAESRLPARLAGVFGVAVWAAIALILVAALFVSNEPQYVAQEVPTLSAPYAHSGLALLAGLPLP